MNDECSCVGCITLIICLVVGIWVITAINPLKVGDVVEWGDAMDVEYTGTILEKDKYIYKVHVTKEYRFIEATGAGGGNGYRDVNYVTYVSKSMLSAANYSGGYSVGSYIIMILAVVVVLFIIAAIVGGGSGGGGFSAR